MGDHVPVTASLAHHLLCAVPQLTDPNFRRRVVFMLDHDERGALGLVINHPSDSPVEEVAEGLGLRWRGNPNDRVMVGGPVEPTRGWILHNDRNWDPVAREVLRGLWLTTSLEQVQRAGHLETAGAGKRVLFMLGYASWAPAQLEAEIAAGGWVAVPMADDKGVSPRWILDTPPERMWEGAMAAIGVDPARIAGVHWGRGNLA